MTKKKPKKTRKHFKINLERIARHIGKIVDNSSIKDIADATLMASLAYLGAQRFHDWKGAFIGPVAFKLATAPGGGTLDPSRLTGVAGLLFLGACVSSNPTGPPEEGGGPGFWEKAVQYHCQEGYVLDWNVAEGWHCKPVFGPPS